MAFEEIRDAIDAAKTILVITHVEPDGDALGSLTAMGLGLIQLGKQVSLVNDNGMLSRFTFLPIAGQVQSGPNPGWSYDLIIALDCGDASRMGRAYADLPEPKPPLINIDHHITNTHFGQWNIVDVNATSTCEMLFAILPALGCRWNADMAQSVLTGLVTDTLCFRTVGVTSKTLHIGSELMKHGADLATITTLAIKVKPLDTLHLYHSGLGQMRLDGGLLWTTLTVEARRAIGYRGSGNGGLVSMLGDTEEARMGLVLTELDNGRVKANFRCRPPFDVSEVAVNLGGGGHALAAGATLEGSLAEVESLVVAVTKEAIERQEEHFFGGD